ncbi:hypothetical protein RhiirA5_415722 [Rhizophagus irregularis]|uniref:Uncharacterized protein n=1 Tax=Rhizophagus irregularis TaxID=588596 RepID=A0A2N0PRF9_9GLOM|nr:hypothetical protein RhiirA5_415722 [Rhizophagus irregularis]
MNVDITSPSALASNLITSVPSGLPVNRVPVITQPPPTNTSLESSIHAHPLPVSTTPLTNDKGKSVAFEVPTRQPSPDGDAAAIKSSPSRFHAAAYLRDTFVTFKEKFPTNCTMCDEVDRALSRYSSYGSRAHCLTWHSPNDAKDLCHVCGRHGCSPSVCSPRPARKTNDRLDKLYTQSNSHSHNRFSIDRSKNPNQSNFGSSHARPPVHGSRSDAINSQRNANANAQSGSNSGHFSSPSPQHQSSLPLDVIDEIKKQPKDIAQQLKDLDEKVIWMEYSITDDDYCIKELESMMNYDDPPEDTPSYAPNSYPNDAGWDYQTDPDNNNNINNTSSFSPVHADSNFSIMDTSPDAFFSSLNSNSILSSRHAPLPNRVNLGGSSNDSSRLRQEISSVSNTQQNLSNQLGSILEN